MVLRTDAYLEDVSGFRHCSGILQVGGIFTSQRSLFEILKVCVSDVVRSTASKSLACFRRYCCRSPGIHGIRYKCTIRNARCRYCMRLDFVHRDIVTGFSTPVAESLDPDFTIMLFRGIQCCTTLEGDLEPLLPYKFSVL
eukprot:IDg16975t1